MALYQIKVNGQVVAERKRLDQAARYFNKVGEQPKEIVAQDGTVMAREECDILTVLRPRGWGGRGSPAVAVHQEDRTIHRLLVNLGLA